MFAAQREHEDIVKILLSCPSCDVQAKNNVSSTFSNLQHSNDITFHRKDKQQEILLKLIIITTYFLYLKKSNHNSRTSPPFLPVFIKINFKADEHIIIMTVQLGFKKICCFIEVFHHSRKLNVL